MMALRSFDQRYAPATIARTREDPGSFVVHAAERATRSTRRVPKSLEHSAEMAAHTGYGTMFGVLYGLWRGRGRQKSALADGILLGAAVYAAGYLGWMPAMGLTRPIWKQPFSAAAGELFRHIIYGVATTASYELIDDSLRN